ncbi:Protein unc-119 homolog B (Protein unc-119 homolog 1) [Durusdinium trenchii]|uniref:Protein unc-119 homolog B (Protein unc-119 homolog 1) n=1 Tax=Durusdinium trenchii TaxID=1381693 RepID=A0ABP0LI24_9DINO
MDSHTEEPDAWAVRSMTSHILAQCSLSQVTKMLSRYRLLQVEHLFAVFAHQSLFRALQLEEPGHVAEFEAWRGGWFCSPLAASLFSLEQFGVPDERWLAIGAMDEEESQAAAEEASCSFLAAQELQAEEAYMRCGSRRTSWAQGLAMEGIDLRRQRVQWVLRQPVLPGVVLELSKTGRGYCSDECECFAPWRGLLCDTLDAGGTTHRRNYSAAIQYIVNEDPTHLAELRHSLRNLWRHFNQKFDYPVQIFHDGHGRPDFRVVGFDGFQALLKTVSSIFRNHLGVLVHQRAELLPGAFELKGKVGTSMAEGEVEHEEYARQPSSTSQVDRTDSVPITPDYVNLFTGPATGFLCSLDSNVYQLQFLDFKIRSLDEGNEKMLFDLAAGSMPSPPPPDIGEDACRFIRYHFGPELLEINTIGTTLEFVNGPYEVHQFRMIERHYFRDQLITSYDFTMPFVMPNSRNTWEMIYTKPLLSEEWKEALRSAPWEARSDSFYFVQDQLIMHNRAEYNYSPY